MKPPRISPLSIRIGTAIFIVSILGALLGWYVYLRQQQGAIQATTIESGLNAPAPSFTGSSGSTPTNQAQANTGAAFAGNATSSAVLWEVDASPVAGMGFVDTATEEYLYYVERGNGYVFSAHPSTQTSVRLTNTLLPKIYEAFFANDGSVIERSIDKNGNLTTFLGTVSASSSVTTSATTTPLMQLSGVYLQTGIEHIALNPVSKAIFYLAPNKSGGVDGITEQWSGTGKTTIFSSNIRSWLPYFLSDGTTILLESPADGMPGYAYSVSASGALTPLVRNVNGLTILPKPSSSLLVYGSSSGNTLSLYGATTSSATLLPVATVADKCVWLPGKSEIVYCAVPNFTPANDFLDNWYKGLADSSDDWWKIDLLTGTSVRIYSPSADNYSFDVENPMIDPSGNYISFINAPDQSLWVLRVTQ
ncbi:MAG TPA: hypothetical protein VMU27_02480 [Candidatus Paceibacterota bacterium]|nr:hypothetical protein [Candidatus Paceibacterota bacterium]